LKTRHDSSSVGCGRAKTHQKTSENGGALLCSTAPRVFCRHSLRFRTSMWRKELPARKRPHRRKVCLYQDLRESTRANVAIFPHPGSGKASGSISQVV
jgi:hypothetical protein